MACDPNFGNVVLLLQFDGTNGQTTTVDSSSFANATSLLAGAAALDTSNPKFGSACFAYNGSGAAFGNSASSTPFAFGTPLDIFAGPAWTIECWFRVASGQAPTVFNYGSNAAGADLKDFQLVAQDNGSGSLTVSVSDGGMFSGLGSISATISTAPNQWHHFAVVSDPATGFASGYLDGQSMAGSGTQPWNATTYNNTNPNPTVCIGNAIRAVSNAPVFVDEFRVSNIVRYTANFTPPTSAFGLSCNVTVPDVVGELDTAAQAAITAVGLIVGTITTVADSSPATTVLAQSPVGGTIATQGDAVGLVESLGPPSGVVPNVIGLNLDAASAALIAAGFILGAVSAAYNNTVPFAQIFDQAPAGGTSEPEGSDVAVTISNGPEPLTVPNVIGMTDAEAASLLTSLLLKHTVTFGFNTVVPAGIIYSQAPSAGQPIAQGGTVSYIVSLGPPVPLLIVPFNVEQTVISQYANSPTLLQLIQNMNAYIDPATNFAAFFNNIWNIDTADTFGLNIWGRILGVSRVIPIPGDNDSFGFDNADSPPDWQTWGNALDPLAGGPFFGGQIGTGSYTLDDAAYRTLLLAKALANIANMSAPSLNQLVSNLFPGRGRAFTTNGRNMTMTYVFEFALSTIELAILQSSGVLPNPAGVTVGITVTP